MEVHDENDATSVRTVQASIEPWSEAMRTKPKKRLPDPQQKLVRFASLHKSEEQEDLLVDAEELEVESVAVIDPLVQSLQSDPSPNQTNTPAVLDSSQEPKDIGTGQTDEVIKPVKRAPTQDIITVVRPESAIWGKPADPGQEQSPLDPDTIQTSGTKLAPAKTILNSRNAKKQEKQEKKEAEKADREERKAQARQSKILKEQQEQKEKEEQKYLKQQKEEMLQRERENREKAKGIRASTASTNSIPVYGVALTLPKATARFLNKRKSTTPSITGSTETRSSTEPTIERPTSQFFSHGALAEPNPSTDQYSPDAERQGPGHAPKLNLNLHGEDMSTIGLPTPHLGPHFARSSLTLREFVLARGKTPSPGLEKTLDFEETEIEGKTLEQLEKEQEQWVGALKI